MLHNAQSLNVSHRLTAEIHYHLGLAQAFHQQFDESVESHKAAIAILKERSKNLKVVESSTKSPRKLAETNQEIAELEALIPEIEVGIFYFQLTILAYETHRKR